MAVVGFDFGTTNSLISVVVGDRAIDILDPENGLPFPSVVRYEGESVVVGRAAKESLATAGIGIHGNTVRSPKFFLGEESVFVGGLDRSPIEIVRDVVAHVKSEALQSPRSGVLDGVTSAVVTIPVSMNGRQRAALRDAFRLADIGIVQFVHEPLAALYGYFRTREDPAAALREYNRRNILVVDWGGGTLDLTLCRLEGDRVLQLRNSGTNDVGGDRFDEAICTGVIERFCNQAGPSTLGEIHEDARIRLLNDSELHKIDLSTRSAVTFYRQGFFRNPDATLEYLLTREAMEEMTGPLVRTGIGRIKSLLEGAGIASTQVAFCLVTGGMASMPAITGRLHELFGPQRVDVSDQSATLIAQGAAWMAHDRQRLRLAKTVELQIARGSYLPLIPADTEMPDEKDEKKRSVHLYCADPRDGLAKFQICCPTRPGSEVQKSDSRTILGNLVVRVDRRAMPFRERLELEMTLDDDMILHARAWSTDVDDLAEAEYHDLEFSISIPAANTTDETQAGDPFPAHFPASDPHQPGDLIVRSNIADKVDDSLVPGELIHTYKPGYLDRRSKPPQVQVEEYLYYQPCAVCGRPSSDPSCRCASLRD